MIGLTSEGAAALRSVLKHGRGRPGQGVKVAPDGRGGLVLTISAPSEGDLVVYHDGAPLLIVAGNLAGRVDGLLFDCLVIGDDDPRIRGFTFRRPSITARSGA
jgi:hypothetical protein